MPSLFILGVSLEGGKGQVVMPAQLVEIEKEKRPDLWDEIRTVSTTGRGLSSMKKDDVLLISGHGSAEEIGTSHDGRSYTAQQVWEQWLSKIEAEKVTVDFITCDSERFIQSLKTVKCPDGSFDKFEFFGRPDGYVYDPDHQPGTK